MFEKGPVICGKCQQEKMGLSGRQFPYHTEGCPFAKLTRPSVHVWLIGMAEHVATRSQWPGMKVGCVVAKDGRIISTGYNGTPRGWHNDLARDAKSFYSHAEENAIVNAARYGISLESCTFYTTISPCTPCARMIVNVGAKQIIYGELWDEHDPMVTQMLKDLGIGFERYVE